MTNVEPCKMCVVGKKDAQYTSQGGTVSRRERSKEQEENCPTIFFSFSKTGFCSICVVVGC